MRYQGKTQPFLTPQMTSHAASRVIKAAALSANMDVFAVADEFTEATRSTNKETGEKGPPRHEYAASEELYVESRYAGGPRNALKLSVTGDYVYAMEYGSEKFPNSNATRGALRSMVRKAS